MIPAKQCIQVYYSVASGALTKKVNEMRTVDCTCMPQLDAMIVLLINAKVDYKRMEINGVEAEVIHQCVRVLLVLNSEI